MDVDHDLLKRFEAGLDPMSLETSRVPATLLGYGEISAIFQIDGDPGTAYKRMPLFSDLGTAETYAAQYHEYCALLTEAGLTLPESDTHIVEVPGHPVVLYIAQRRFPPDRVAHRVIHTLERADFQELTDRVVREIEKVWAFNRDRGPALELAIDGQISNWVLVEEEGASVLYFVDTSTPLFRKLGLEQLNPRLLLQAAPGYLRWILEWLFLDDVMNRYYDPRKVYTDLAANLHKEQLPELIPDALRIINGLQGQAQPPLTGKELNRYYREDKIIWSVFLALRRFDRWVSTRLLRRRYEFILPGKIER
jgi:hypothetical protein